MVDHPHTITLPKLPTDLLIFLGKFLKTTLNDDEPLTMNDISEVTLAAILNDYQMLTHYLQLYRPSNICKRIAMSGNLYALKWAKDNGGLVGDQQQWTCYYAAASGNLDMLQWLETQGFSWYDPDTCAAAAAAQSGNIPMLQWLRSQGCPWDERTCAAAAANGHLDLLQWLRSQDSVHGVTGHVRLQLKEKEIYKLLKWRKTEACPWNKDSCTAVAKSRHFKVLEWLYNQGCPFHEETCAGAAEGEDTLK